MNFILVRENPQDFPSCCLLILRNLLIALLSVQLLELLPGTPMSTVIIVLNVRNGLRWHRQRYEAVAKLEKVTLELFLNLYLGPEKGLGK